MSRFSDQLVRWQKEHGRHDLPWQNTRDPYRIWLSEIMLQQTQVTTVIPYYQRFLERFPTLSTLAQAPLDDVLTLWSGLGYYTRARNLHSAARQVVAQHGGDFPRDADAVRALPGIGRSTAAAICVFAYGQRGAILDGNVKRVLARRFAIAGYPGDAKVQEALWRTAERELAQKDVETYTQALMDLGATLCTRTRPRCEACPVEAQCMARREGAIARYPAARPRKALPQRHTRMLVLLHAGSVLLEKRAPTGIWGGLWSLPEVADHENIAVLCARRFGATIGAHDVLPTVAHGFTHFKLDIEPQRLIVDRLATHAAEPGVVWLPLADALDAAIPAPVRRILADLYMPAQRELSYE